MLKDKMLSWASRFGIFLWLDSHGYDDRYGKYECLLGISNSEFRISDCMMRSPSFSNAEFGIQDSEWLMGHLCYDYKNVLEPQLQSRYGANTGFEPARFFRPDVVCYIPRGTTALHIESLEATPDLIFSEISKQDALPPAPVPKVRFTPRISRDKYLKKVAALRSQIYEGDCYEINFCNEAFAEDISLDALAAYKALTRASSAPFSAFYKTGASYLICASPERFLTKRGRRIISQPIKGTAPRGTTAKEDEALKAALLASEKERAENVMIVDLVRNDLAQVCETGSIAVDELFGIYTYPHVHQMTSTVSGELQEGRTVWDAIRKAFPMGSMTGAPKFRVMQLIDAYEEARRELFSGTVGYISPDGDADFNVVIRSLFYNTVTKRLSYQAGGAVTWDSTPEGEWEEMRLKAMGMERLFE